MANTSSTPANTLVGLICRVTRSHDKYPVPLGYQSKAFPAAFLAVERGELGEIIDVARGEKARAYPSSYVRLHDRPGKPVIFLFNNLLEISTARWDQDWEFSYDMRTTNKLQPVGNVASTHTPTGLETHILGFLSGVRDNYNRIPNLDKYQQHLKTPESLRATAYTMTNNVLPRVKSVLERPDFTLQDVLDAGQEFGNYQHENNGYRGIFDRDVYSGIYLNVYWDFPPSSRYRGYMPYVGQSNHIARRGFGHRVHTFDKKAIDYNSEQYKCAREARKWRMVRVLVQRDPKELMNDRTARKFRDIYEDTFFVLLRTYHPRAYDLDTLPKTGAGKAPEKSLTSSMAHIKLGHLYTSIATTSFANTRYSDPATRTATSGWASGLNVASPLDGTGLSLEKTPICSQYLRGQNRKVFHFPAKIAVVQHGGLNDIRIFYKNYTDDSGKLKTMKLHWSGPVSSLKPGDELYVSWELMDEEIEHPAPAFPMGRIGCWSNWAEVGRLGLKATFKRAGSTKWHAMYVQWGSFRNDPIVEGVPGATKSYAYGTAMLAYLQNTRWGQKESWIPYFGVPNMVEVQVQRLYKRVVCRPVQPSRPLPNITYQPDTAERLLIDLKARDANGVVVSQETLQNVNGPFGQFDTSSSWVSGRLRNFYLKRARCDRCWFGHLSDQVDMNLHTDNKDRHCIPMKDNLGQNTNQCRPCFLRGLPCSWTRADWLGGPHWAKNNPAKLRENLRNARHFSGPLWNEFYESVYGKLTPSQFLEPKEVPDPGYAKLLAPEGGMEEEEESDAEVDELFDA
ncbi:hypothetical protein KC343_g1637 [Hortaea werneckii]|uniref:Uncharacterized protein n=1 Tax=Hortaea werneckii TaxID=91943 RepID=A0A3M7HG93_HORWE|nr:hypothetical protein KC352_g7674 [Hortaea werneckii]KAI7570249.1 hypothetical protein KC317_g2626 [Hortaea werneckii]KAI7626621.1 hypothetical protein KC346_g1167 [Hortaea werneckii]KAI7635745.1 hypothetical protein KC343_g1637 [Hortaea werneckii]KAI7682359.1 hypothetical protein KC319_g1062 [Hortaea werneckii]